MGNEVIDHHFAKWKNWSRRAKDLIQRRVDSMAENYDKKSKACDFDLGVFADERYDSNDPCRASKQLTRDLIKWAALYNRNCPKKKDKFVKKITNQMKAYEKKLKKRHSDC